MIRKVNNEGAMFAFSYLATSTCFTNMGGSGT